MKIIAPGDDKYEEMLKGILAHLDERARRRRETPEFKRLQKELCELEAKMQTDSVKKVSDDEAFLILQRQQKIEALKTAIEHHMDDVHQAERGYRVHRRQFEEALEKHRAMKIQGSPI